MHENSSHSESSYGIVPLKRRGREWDVLLIQHGTAGYWGFPKGHAEPEETPMQAAARELKEETGLEIVRFLSDAMLKEHYWFHFKQKRISKNVFLFIAEVAGQVEIQVKEVRDSKWVPLAEAVEHLTYENDKSICRSVIALVD